MPGLRQCQLLCAGVVALDGHRGKAGSNELADGGLANDEQHNGLEPHHSVGGDALHPHHVPHAPRWGQALAASRGGGADHSVKVDLLLQKISRTANPPLKNCHLTGWQVDRLASAGGPQGLPTPGHKGRRVDKLSANTAKA